MSVSGDFTIDPRTGRLTLKPESPARLFRVKANSFITHQKADHSDLKWYIEVVDATTGITKRRDGGYVGYVESAVLEVRPGESVRIVQMTSSGVPIQHYHDHRPTFIVERA